MNSNSHKSDTTKLESIAEVLVAMSGGVDSSAAALLLLDEGYDCVGVTMKLIDEDLLGQRIESGCCSVEDVEDAKSVCRTLGIEHFVFNLKKSFEKNVVKKFCSAYIHGLTPNPCIDCNRYLKFEELQRRRKELGAAYVATGHYARRRFDAKSKTWQLLRAIDPKKDQSYVLYHLTQDNLEHMLFPLGDFTKEEVRKITRERGFTTAEKPESQDICFIPDGNYAAFISDYLGSVNLDSDSSNNDSLDSTSAQALYEPGDIVDVFGKRLGSHNGLAHYTIGQRKGIGIAHSEPLYVLDKDIGINQLIVAPKSDLYDTEAYIDDVNIISGNIAARSFPAQVKAGYRQKPSSAHVELAGDTSARIIFDEPHIRTAPGQSIVFYDGEVVIGGGCAIR